MATFGLFPAPWRACLAMAWLALQAGYGVAQPAEQPVRGGTLVYPVHMGEPNTLDCHAGYQALAFRASPHYSQLVKIDAERYPQVKGDLAQSWKIAADGLSYEFKLHPNVKFHDGSTLTSNDVKVSLDRLRNPPPGVVSVRKAMFEDIKAVEAPDPRTLVVRLSAPNATLLQLLGMPYACVYSARLLAEDPSYPAKKVMGSGPFRFVRHVPGQEWVGERFDGYFRPGLPYLDGFRALATTQPGAVTAMLAGQVHYTMVGLTAAEVERVRNSRRDKVAIVGGAGAHGLQIVVAVNTQKPPLDDVRVRRALNLALDRYAGSRAMANLTSIHLVGGMSRPGSRFARTEQALQELPGLGRDIEASRAEARRLLAEAGHPQLKLSFDNRAQSTFWGVYLADQFRQIGVTLEHRVNDSPQIAARKTSGDYELIVDSPPEYLDDPTVMWSVFKPFNDNPTNLARTNDPKLAQLYEAQKRAVDPEQRRVHVQAMEQYVLEQAYVLPLFWHHWRRAVSSELRGLGDIPSNFLKLDLSEHWLHSAAQAK